MLPPANVIQSHDDPNVAPMNRLLACPDERTALDVAMLRQAMVDWLTAQALPFWAQHGVDHVRGGFFEKLSLAGHPSEELRRTRVVARQVYVFATAARRNWLPGSDRIVEHGLDFLLQRLRRPDGLYCASIAADGSEGRPEFDLYEHAFALFALAEARRGRPDRDHLVESAATTLESMRRGWRHPRGGFEESCPPSSPLKSNPHMHLLEAALAWSDVLDDQRRIEWECLSDELAMLALEQFVDPETGALGEYFDENWHSLPSRTEAVVEPGHQFEWSWLLRRWAMRRRRHDAMRVADRLLAIGEQRGVDSVRNAAVNSLRGDLTVADAEAKLWPQTERLKAWWLTATLEPQSTSPVIERVLKAAQGLNRFLVEGPPGRWRERMRADGGFIDEDCRASSLYHIVCAIECFASGDRRVATHQSP